MSNSTGKLYLGLLTFCTERDCREIYRNKTSLKVKSMMSVLGKLSGEFEIAAIIGGFYKYFIKIPEKTLLPYLPL